MNRKALLMSFASHLTLLFLLIAGITFLRKDFDMFISVVVSIVYIGSLIIYLIIFIVITKMRMNFEKDAKSSSIRGALRYWLFVIFYVSLIVYLSSLPKIPFISQIQEMDPRRFALHILEYMGLSFLLFFSLYKSGLEKKKAFLLSIGMSMVIGYGDERLQFFIPGRRFNLFDIYSDWVGAFVGSISAFLVTRFSD